MTEQPDAPVRTGLMRLGLWGAPASGKTTYLAALKVAVTRYEGDGNWLMFGADEDSEQFLSQSSHELLHDRIFPQATIESKEYRFRFAGEIPQPAAKPVRFRRPAPDPGPLRLSFDLDVLDPPGKWYGRASVAAQEKSEEFNFGPGPASELMPDGQTPTPQPQEGAEQLLDHLEDCQGILFLFDPVRDAHLGDTFDWLHHSLGELSRRILTRPRSTLTRLPQYFAVCVTKFDDVNVSNRARKLGVIEPTFDEPYVERVPDESAEDLFRDLCTSGGGNGDLVFKSLHQHIRPDRLRFFVTSAIGQYVDASGRFKRQDSSNVTRLHDGTLAVRGAVRPVNLFEPLLWLENSVRRDRGR